jgi:hypothetical protein
MGAVRWGPVPTVTATRRDELAANGQPFLAVCRHIMVAAHTPP